MFVNLLSSFQLPKRWLWYRQTYTCQLSRLRAENFNLTPTHACGPNSHAWMKNVSYNSLNWNTFLKDVNLHQFEKRKLPVIQKVNEYTRNLWFLWFLTRKALRTRSCLATLLWTGSERYTRWTSELFRTSSDVFGSLQKTSDMFESSSDIVGRLAGIQTYPVNSGQTVLADPIYM